MIRVISLLFLICANFNSYALDTQVTLSMHDHFGQILRQPIAGVPFTVDLDLESGQQQTVTLNKIVNLENFEHKNNGVVNRLNIINGVAQTHKTYSYLVRIDQSGNFTLGPAELSVNGKLIKSNQLTFQVIDNTNNNLGNSGPDNTEPVGNLDSNSGNNNNNGSRNSSGQANNNLRNEPIFLKLLGPIKPVFVGEKFKVIIRIYSNLEQLQLTNLEQVSHKSFKIGPVNKASSGTIVIRNSTYSYQDYEQILTAAQAGDFLIPALALDYAVPNRKSGWFFMNSYSSRQTYSNSLKITVQNLPQNKFNNTKINYVGVFKDLKLTVNKSDLTRGEGGLISLSLTGSSERPYDLDDLKLDQLELPDNLRTFYSKTERLGPAKLQFDFVVQGLQIGEFTIPAQKFIFFNPEVQKYQELTTKPIKLVITEPDNNLNHISNSKSNTKKNYALSSCADLQIDHEINPIICSLNLNTGRKLLIPKSWFLNLTSLLLLFLVGLGGLAGYKYYIRQTVYVRKRAFRQAELDLKQVTNIQGVYQVFLNLFNKLGVKNFGITSYSASDLNFQTQVISWTEFWQILVHASFDKSKISPDKLQELVAVSQNWLKFWEGKL